MNVIIGRLAAAIATALVLWLLNLLGIDVTEEQRGQAIAWLSQGITAIGYVLGLMLYATFHKVFDKYLNPMDTAQKRPVYDNHPIR